MEARAASDQLSHRLLPAIPVPLPLAGVIGGKPGPLQFVSCAASNASKIMSLDCGPAAVVKQEAFCIRWKGFQGNIIDSLGGVRGDEDFADVTISCCGAASSKPVRAHKLILASCSNYFRRILRDTPCQHPVIILGDVEHSILEALVTYMYRGEVFVSEDRLPSFFAAAQSLEIKGIADPPAQNSNSPPQTASMSMFSAQPSRGFPFALPPVVLPSSPSSTSSASSSSPSVQHPVGDLSLLAAAASATQRPSVVNGLNGSEATSGGGSTKRRKTTPRRLEVGGNSYNKMPKLSSPDRDVGGTNGQDAINLSTKHLLPESVSSIYVNKAGLLNIPNPCGVNFNKCETKVELPSSPVALDMTRPPPSLLPPPSICNGSPPPLQIGQAALPPLPLLPPGATMATSPGGDAENASPNLADIKTAGGLSIKLPKVPVGPIGPGDDEEEDDEDEGEGGGEGGDGEMDAASHVDGLLPVSSSTTPEQMAALLGPSWKSRQPRMCQYCQRMFSNKFNLKQHILNMHTVGREMHCEICQKKVKNKWYLRRHHVTHHGAPLKK